MTFPTTLRVAALAIVLAMTVRYLLLGALMAPPFVTVCVLLALSFAHSRWPRASAALTLVPGVLIPVLVLLGYLNGGVELPLVVFDWLLFAWVDWRAIAELRRTPTRVRAPEPT